MYRWYSIGEGKLLDLELSFYFEKCELLIESIKKNLYGEITESEDKEQLLKNLNIFFYKELLESNYKKSYGNPNFTEIKFGKEMGRILSSIYYEIRKGIKYSYHKENKNSKELIKLLEELIKDCKELKDVSSLMEVFKNYKSINRKYEMEYLISLDTTDDTYNRILMESNFNNLSYLYKYGNYITDIDIKLAQFINNYDEAVVDKIADVIVKAFLHGFISQNRDRRERKGIKLIYTIGQEKIAKKVVEKYNNMNIYPKVFGVSSYQEFKQYEYDHRFDEGLYIDENVVNIEIEEYMSILKNSEEKLLDICGMIGIGSFGRLEAAPISKNNSVKLSEDQKMIAKKLGIEKKKALDFYIKPSDISFCIVTFPNPSIKGNYERIFEDFVRINTTDSQEYEVLQQKIIDILDLAKEVEVKGKNGNRTCIRVAMNTIKNPEKETNFLNCGGDLNIPHGEVFTTPRLRGTNGKLHFKNIFLKGYSYVDLELDFVDGQVVKYTCKNFNSDEDNKTYIMNTLFNGNENIPMGEFAIGSNTLAYEIIKKHNIVEELPILLVEKMGPHFAIGDPCYSFGEDGRIYNLIDGKEITAKENEKTALRNVDVHKAYTGVHVDMTVPYEDIETLNVITEDGVIEVIKDGLFAINELRILNEPLIRLIHNKVN